VNLLPEPISLLHFNFAFVRFDGLFDQTQAQTVAVNLLVNDRCGTVKRLENVRQIFFGDAQSFIFNRDFDLSFAAKATEFSNIFRRLNILPN
jgi:hypothetical protein